MVGGKVSSIRKECVTLKSTACPEFSPAVESQGSLSEKKPSWSTAQVALKAAASHYPQVTRLGLLRQALLSGAEARASANTAPKYPASRLRTRGLVDTVTRDDEGGCTSNFPNSSLNVRKDKASREAKASLRATQRRIEENTLSKNLRILCPSDRRKSKEQKNGVFTLNGTNST